MPRVDLDRVESRPLADLRGNSEFPRDPPEIFFRRFFGHPPVHKVDHRPGGSDGGSGKVPGVGKLEGGPAPARVHGRREPREGREGGLGDDDLGGERSPARRYAPVSHRRKSDSGLRNFCVEFDQIFRRNSVGGRQAFKSGGLHDPVRELEVRS